MVRFCRKFAAALWGLSLVFGCAGEACAGTATATFNVTATVLGSCAVTAADLAFGTYNASDASPTTANSTIDVTCTSGTSYTVALDGGSVANDVTARAMSDGAAHSLSYALYTTSGYSTIWGDGTASTGTVAGTGNGSAQALTVYGRIPANQYIAANTYTDQITVTVSY
jgi:spore coat protein U-like protein